jgi:Fe-S-cluster containining protein
VSRRIRVLAVHADYGCRHTGVCCESGWDIPVEPEVEDGLRRAMGEGRLGTTSAFREVPGLPHGARVVLRTDEQGRCVFLEAGRGNLCAVHRTLGPGALASACRDFPRVVVADPRGVSITLSHFCPTAATMLFRSGDGEPAPGGEDPQLRVVEGAPALPTSWPYEGLDARQALPPLLRPGVLSSWQAHERWEAHQLATLAREGIAPESAIGALAAQAEALRRWTPRDGPFDRYLDRVLDGPTEPALPPVAPEEAWGQVSAAVPSRYRVEPPPPGLAGADDRWVEPRWHVLARPIRRWLAARAFASWLSLQGDGLRTAVLGLRLACGVLRVEAVRGCQAAERPLDAALLTEAVRRADLVLVHLVDPAALARRLSRCETAPGGPPGA